MSEPAPSDPKSSALKPANQLIDLDALAMQSGEGAWMEMDLSPSAPILGGEQLELETDPISTRIDISRTSSGYALRLRAEAVLVGTCARCLGPARLVVEIESREVDQGVVNDPELRSPYVGEGLLDVGGWLHDALALGAPERLLCRSDCAGLCEICGISLNDIEPGSHVHESPPDPRFAKLRDLIE